MDDIMTKQPDAELKARINAWANEVFEKASELDCVEDSTIEAAVQRLSEAADRLSRLTQSE